MRLLRQPQCLWIGDKHPLVEEVLAGRCYIVKRNGEREMNEFVVMKTIASG